VQGEDAMEKKKIVIVDDEPDILDILRKKFTQNNYDVLVMANGAGFITHYKSFRPDIFILDIAMPELDGYSMATLIREDKDLENIPIIFMTAKELEFSGIQKRIVDLGGCDFIPKPCLFEDLLAKVKEKIGG